MDLISLKMEYLKANFEYVRDYGVKSGASTVTKKKNNLVSLV